MYRHIHNSKRELINYFCFFNPGHIGLRKQLRQNVSIVRRGGSRMRT